MISIRSQRLWPTLLGESDKYCNDIDLGPTVYHDTGTGARGVMSTAMKIGYMITSPYYAAYDLMVCLTE